MQISRNCHALIKNTPSLQHRIECFLADVIENPSQLGLPLQSRLNAVRRYRSARHAFRPYTRSTITMGLKDSGLVQTVLCVGSTYATLLPGDDATLEFYRMPSPARHVPEKRWTLSLKGTSSNSMVSWAFDDEQDLLVLPRQ